MKAASMIIIRLRAEKHLEMIKIGLNGANTKAQVKEIVDKSWL